MRAQPYYYSDSVTQRNQLLFTPDELYLTVQESGNGIQLIPDDGTLDTPISTPEIGFGAWFFFPSQASTSLYLLSTFASNGESFINFRTQGSTIHIDGDYISPISILINGGLAGIWVHLAFQSGTGTPSYIYLNGIENTSFNLLNPSQSSSKCLRIGKAGEAYFGKVNFIVVFFEALLSISSYFERQVYFHYSHTDIASASGYYFDLRTLYQIYFPSLALQRLSVSDTDGYFTEEKFMPFNPNGYATLSSGFSLIHVLSSAQQNSCSLALQIWFTHTNGQAQIFLTSSTTSSFLSSISITQITLNPTFLAAYDRNGISELLYSWPFSSSQWHSFFLFIPNLSSFDYRFYGVTPHNLWKFPDTCTSLRYSRQYMKISSVITGISLRAIRLWIEPQAQSPHFFLDFATRKHKHNGILSHLVFTADCTLIDISDISFNRNDFSYLYSLSGCTGNPNSSGISNTNQICFYDAYNYPSDSCMDYSPLVALPTDNIGIELYPNLAFLSTYSIEFWIYFGSTGSVFQIKSNTGNTFYQMTVVSYTLSSMTGELQIVGPSDNDKKQLSSLRWHHYSANFDIPNTQLTNIYQGITDTVFATLGSQDTIGTFRLCGGNTNRGAQCSMAQFKMWRFVRSEDSIVATMHRRLKSEETGDLFYYFYLDSTENIANNLIMNRGAPNQEIQVTTTDFKVMSYLEGDFQPLPRPPLCESNETYLSLQGRCKASTLLSQREGLRYLYTQEQHPVITFTVLHWLNELNNPLTKDWTFTFWINALTLRRDLSYTSRIVLEGLTNNKYLNMGWLSFQLFAISYFSNSILQYQQQSKDQIQQSTWYFTAVRHNPSNNGFSNILLSNSNYNSISIPALDNIADDGLKISLNYNSKQKNIAAIASLAFYKEFIASDSDLISLAQTDKLLAYFPMRDKYFFNQVPPPIYQQQAETLLQWRLFSFQAPSDTLTTMQDLSVLSNIETIYSSPYDMNTVSKKTYALNIPAGQTYSVNLSPSLTAEHFAFGLLVSFHFKVSSLSSALQIKLPDLFSFTFQSTQSTFQLSTSNQSNFGIPHANWWNSVVGYLNKNNGFTGTYLNSNIVFQYLTQAEVTSLQPIQVITPPQISIVTSAVSQVSLKNIYVTNQFYNIKQVGTNPASLPSPDHPSMLAYFLFTKLDTQLVEVNSGEVSNLGGASFVEDYSEPFQMCQYPARANSYKGEHCIQSGEGILFQGETAFTDLNNNVIPPAIAGQLFWKFNDDLTIGTCAANILHIHANYQLTLINSNEVQINGVQVAQQSFSKATWYHFGFVYDKPNNVQNVLLSYTRHSPNIFPDIADLNFELKLGANCGACSLKLLKLYRYVYSPAIVALMGRPDHPLNNIFYFEFSQYSQPFYTEVTSGNQYNIDASQEWNDQSLATSPLCEVNQVFSNNQCASSKQSLKLNSDESIPFADISIDPVIFTLNLWISVDPAGLATSPHFFLQAWDFSLLLDSLNLLTAVDSTDFILKVLDNFELTTAQWHFVTFQRQVTQLDSYTYFSRDCSVIKSLTGYTPTTPPTSHALKLNGGGTALDFYIAHLSLFDSFMPNGLLKAYRYTNMQFHLYNYRGVQLYYFYQLTDSNQIVEWKHGNYITLHSSFSLAPFTLNQMCEFDYFYNYETEMCQGRERFLSFSSFTLPIDQLVAPYSVDQSFTLVFWMRQMDPLAQCTALFGLIKFTSNPSVTKLEDSAQDVKYSSTQSFELKWAKVAISLKLHNLYSLHIKADGAEIESSGSDLNELEMTPIIIGATLHHTVFREIVLYNYFVKSSVQSANYLNFNGLPQESLRYSLRQNSGRLLFESAYHNHKVDHLLPLGSYKWMPGINSLVDLASYTYMPYFCLSRRDAQCAGSLALCDPSTNQYLDLDTLTCLNECPLGQQNNHLNICERKVGLTLANGEPYVEPVDPTPTPTPTPSPTQPEPTPPDPNFTLVEKETIQSVKTTVEASINSALVGGLTANMFFKGGGQYMWSLINGFQFFPFILVMDVHFPQNCDIVLRGFELANFDSIEQIIQTPFSTHYLTSQYEVAPINLNFADHEMPSRVLFRLYEAKLLFIVGILLVTPLLMLIAIIFRSLKWQGTVINSKRLERQVKRCYGVDFILTLLIEEYLQVCVYSLSCLEKLRFSDGIWTALSLYEAITLLYLAAFLLMVCYLLLKFTMNPKTYKQKESYFLFDGVRVVRGSLESVDSNAQNLPTRFSRFYFSLFLLRRIIFASVIVFLRNNTRIQLGVLVLLSTLQIVFLCAFKPLALKCRLFLEIIDEVMFITVLAILYILKYWNQSHHEETYGLVIIGMIGGVLVAKLLAMIIVIVKQMVIKCKTKKKDSKIKPNHFISELTFTETKGRRQINLGKFISAEHNMSQISLSAIDRGPKKELPTDISYDDELNQSYLKIANKGRGIKRVII